MSRCLFILQNLSAFERFFVFTETRKENKNNHFIFEILTDKLSTMEKYRNNNGDSGVRAYQIGSNYVWVEFSTGSIYEYTYDSAGVSNIESMKSLARSGSGLNGFINTYVKFKYSRKIK